MPNAINASLMEKDKSYVIKSFNDEAIALRMLSMGILPGQEIRIVNKSPFGYSYYVSIGKRWVAVRAEELSAIECTEADALA